MAAPAPYLIDAAHFGNLAGATDIIFHPGTYFGRPADEVLKVVIPRLQGCVDELRQAGNPVTLRPEISGKAAMLGSLADILEMAQAIPGVVPCIDFAHLHARLGDGAMNTYAEWISALEYYRKSLGEAACSTCTSIFPALPTARKAKRTTWSWKRPTWISRTSCAPCTIPARRAASCAKAPPWNKTPQVQALWLEVSGETP